MISNFRDLGGITSKAGKDILHGKMKPVFPRLRQSCRSWPEEISAKLN